MSCDVDSGTCDFRLDLSHLFYLCKFNLAVHRKCWKGAFCMDYEAKFRGKKSEISQTWTHTFLNLRHNSEHVDAVISSTGGPQENRIFRFLKIYKKIVFFFSNWKFFSHKFITWNSLYRFHPMASSPPWTHPKFSFLSLSVSFDGLKK